MSQKLIDDEDVVDDVEDENAPKKKKKYERDYGDIETIKREFEKAGLPEFVQRRIRSDEVQSAIYEEHALEFPDDLETKVSKDFFKSSWIEDFYYQVLSYDLLHSGDLDNGTTTTTSIHDFFRMDTKRLVMEMAIPIEHDSEFNLQKAYCFLRSFVDPHFDNEIHFWNLSDVRKKIQFGEGDIQFAKVTVCFRNFQFFKMLSCVLAMLQDARAKELETHTSYSLSDDYLEIIIKDIGELDLPDDVTFDYFLWRYPLRFLIYGFDHSAFKFFNFIPEYEE